MDYRRKRFFGSFLVRQNLKEVLFQTGIMNTEVPQIFRLIRNLTIIERIFIMDKNLNDEKKQPKKNKKDEQLDQFRVDDSKESLTTNQGLKMAEDEFSLKAGERGPTLMEDFHFIEKIAHFDHEIEVDHNFDTTDAVLYDALYIVGGDDFADTFIQAVAKYRHYDRDVEDF